MKRYILTGAPGAGKTAIIRQLELDGFSVVEEAATDLIALSQAQGIVEPWTHPSFVDSVCDLQKRRLIHSSQEPVEVQLHDRSAICTAALAVYLEFPRSAALSRELERIQFEGIYQSKVFFLRNLGFVAPTAARRISFDETLRFEDIHEEIYRRFGFDLVFVEPASLSDRVAAIRNSIHASPRESSAE